jgi:hypothetical protein
MIRLVNTLRATECELLTSQHDGQSHYHRSIISLVDLLHHVTYPLLRASKTIFRIFEKSLSSGIIVQTVFKYTGGQYRRKFFAKIFWRYWQIR